MVKNGRRVIAIAMTAALCLSASPAHVESATAASTKETVKTDNIKVRKLDGREAAGEFSTATRKELDGFTKDVTYPVKFDLHDAEHDSVTSVKLQGPFGTCWTFGAMAAAEITILNDLGVTNTRFKELFGRELNLSEKHMAYYGYHPVSKDDPYPGQIGEGNVLVDESSATKIYDNGGSDGQATGLLASGVGPVIEPEENDDDSDNLRYEFYDKDGNRIFKRSDIDKVDPASYTVTALRFQSDFKLTDGNIIPGSSNIKKNPDGSREYLGYNELSTNAVKEQLYTGHGVVCSYYGDHSMPGETEELSKHFNYKNWAQYDNEHLYASHAVTIVGWDDTYPKENFAPDKVSVSHEMPAGDGAWIVKNSWGDASWAEKTKDEHNRWGINDTGYFYLSYYDHSITLYETMDFDTTDTGLIQDAIIDQYDMMPSMALSETADGNSIALENADTPIKMANVFTATREQKINSVGITSALPNTRAVIRVYKFGNDTNVTDPEKGELVDVKIATFKYAGFHRVNLNGEYHIKEGEKYSVIVTESVPFGDGMKYLAQAAMGMNKDSTAITGKNSYSVAVVNAGESFINLGSSWEDWSTLKVKYEQNEGPICIDNFAIKAFAAADPIANTMKVTVSKKTVKAGALKKKAKVIAPITVKNAKGSVSYFLVSSAASKKALKLNTKTGKITVKKNTKKGTYKLKVKVTADGNQNHKSAGKTVTVTVKVK